MRRLSRIIAPLTCLVVAAILLVALPNPGRASLLKPDYVAGDRWVYVLDGSLKGFPGLNSSGISNVRFGIVGLVTFNVIGPSGNASLPTVRVDSRATGYLNGSFVVSGGGTATVTGSFTTSTSEYWELQAYLPIASNSTTSYRADVTYGFITTPLSADFRANTTTTIVPIPPFALDVGQSVNATLSTHLELNSTFTVFGQTSSMQNSTDVSSVWHREVLSKENVTVEAGTFSAYRLNQTLGSFPGLPSGLSGGNETADFSNDVGFYAKRTAYQNGTPAAKMQLKSYSYGASPASGLSLANLLIYVAIPVVAAVLILFASRRRRKARIQEPASEAAPSDAGRR